MNRCLVVVLLAAAASSGFAQTPAQPPAASAAAPYGTVVDGIKVNGVVMEGFRAWRAGACDRCHGANQEGMVGPSLVDRLKVLSKDEFVKSVAEGRVEKGMPGWKENKAVMDHIDGLYAYLKGRSDGAIIKARVQPQP